jgi:uncharacterized protein YbaR (Trm112 family)
VVVSASVSGSCCRTCYPIVEGIPGFPAQARKNLSN